MHAWHEQFMRENLYDVVALHTIWNQQEFERLLGPQVNTERATMNDSVQPFFTI